MKIGLGTAAIGRPQYINLKQTNQEVQDLATFKRQGLEVLEQAYKQGIRYFDTAPGYGMAEQLLLEWLAAKNDSSIEIGTKWGYTYVANFDPAATVHEVKEHSLPKLNEQWEVSKGFLPKLKTYQIHSATLETKVLENKAILNRLIALKEEHSILIGLSTTGANQLEVLNKALDVSINGVQVFDTFQVTYNILDQSLRSNINTLHEQGKTILIKEALANGRLFRNTTYPAYENLYGYLEQLAAKHQVGVDAIALAFCGQTIPKSIVLSGATNEAHLQANLKANSIELSPDELNTLYGFQVENEFYWNERKQLAWQ